MSRWGQARSRAKPMRRAASNTTVSTAHKCFQASNSFYCTQMFMATSCTSCCTTSMDSHTTTAAQNYGRSHLANWPTLQNLPKCPAPQNLSKSPVSQKLKAFPSGLHLWTFPSGLLILLPLPGKLSATKAWSIQCTHQNWLILYQIVTRFELTLDINFGFCTLLYALNEQPY